jgi:ATPase subunit of ABC transporter with duplicated ATPase domains
MTPDGREVDFRCHHNHRTQSAALDCASTVRKQIERGQSLHLITRVRSTPASREAAHQRAVRQEAERKTKAAQRAQEAQQRGQRREAAAQERAQQREAHALQRQQQAAERHAQRAEAARQRAERKEESALPIAGRPTQAHQPTDQQWDRHHHRASRSQVRRSHGWPTIGLIIAGTTALLSVVLVGIAGNNPHSALAATAGGLFILGVLAAVVCAAAALWRRLRTGKRASLHS